MEEHSPVIQGHVDVFLKKYYDKVEINSENLEKALKILSRVFRNSTLNDLQTSKLFLDYILQCACHLGFVLIDETKESNQKIENIDDASAKKVLRLWVNFIPLIVETFLFDSLAQDDLDRLFRIKLEELKKEPNKNQYLITILYLLLIDLNPAKNQELIIDAIKDINLGMLQNTILVKLYYYLIFETHGKKQFEDYLRARIRELVKKINPATDNASIDKRLSQLSKASLIENAKK